MTKTCSSSSRLCLIFLAVVLVVQGAKRKVDYIYSMRDPVKIGHVAKVHLPSEGNRVVDVVTVSDEAAGVRAFTVDDLLSGEECDEIASLTPSEKWDNSRLNTDEETHDFIQKMSGSKQEQQQMFADWDDNKDDHLSRFEVEQGMKISLDIVDLNYNDFLLRYVRVPEDSLQGHSMSSKDFVQVDWKGFLKDMAQNHPHRFTRSSDTAWVSFKPPVMQRLLKKVGAVTGLDWKTMWKATKKEPLQLLHYPAGGAHFSCHHDSTPETTHDFRFITFFIFLSDVSEGGETVLFGADVNGSHPDRRTWKAGDWVMQNKLCQSVESCPKHPGGSMPEEFRGAAVVKPKKGRVLFWYNWEVDSKGRGTKFVWSSLHAGCPTLKEEKWAANVWLYAGDPSVVGQKAEL